MNDRSLKIEFPCRDEKHAEDVYDALKVLLFKLNRRTNSLAIFSDMRRPPDPASVVHSVRYGTGWLENQFNTAPKP